MHTIPTYMYENPDSSFILSFQNLKTLIRETDGVIVLGGVFRDIIAKKLPNDTFKITFKPIDTI